MTTLAWERPALQKMTVHQQHAGTVNVPRTRQPALIERIDRHALCLAQLSSKGPHYGWCCLTRATPAWRHDAHAQLRSHTGKVTTSGCNQLPRLRGVTDAMAFRDQAFGRSSDAATRRRNEINRRAPVDPVASRKPWPDGRTVQPRVSALKQSAVKAITGKEEPPAAKYFRDKRQRPASASKQPGSAPSPHSASRPGTASASSRRSQQRTHSDSPAPVFATKPATPGEWIEAAPKYTDIVHGTSRLATSVPAAHRHTLARKVVKRRAHSAATNALMAAHFENVPGVNAHGVHRRRINRMSTAHGLVNQVPVRAANVGTDKATEKRLEQHAVVYAGAAACADS